MSHTTLNGATTLATSGDACVDFFFAAGASRGRTLTAEFDAAFAQDRELALRILLWMRDARGGAGERDSYRAVLRHMETRPELSAILEGLIVVTPSFGRWDDLLVFDTLPMRALAYGGIALGLYTGDARCAKWMPRKGKDAARLRDFMGLTPKDYRRLLVDNSRTVEQQMCAGRWDDIDFSRLPSLAAARYQNAFARRCAERYAEYKTALANGTAKINAGAIFPHDVLKALRHGDEAVAEAQWAALPNYLGDSRILPMVDVSGSMSNPASGAATSAMDIAIALGLYVAEKQTGRFQDMVLTFSGDPAIQRLAGTLAQKTALIREMPWGMNTDIDRAFSQILMIATKYGVPQAEMPQYLLVLSDMEFDASAQCDDRAFVAAKQRFQRAGYALPKIVFWNLRARPNNVPVRFDEGGTALVSGYSPAILKAILAGEASSPQAVMRAAVGGDRYAVAGRL